MSAHTRRGRGMAYAATAVAASALALIPALGSAQPNNNPPGANGTIKIDGVAFDSHPNNQPHVSCIFQVDFYGFDQGDYNAKVVFEVIPPSRRPPRVIPLDGEPGVHGPDYGVPSVGPRYVFVGEDPAGGGTDVDAQQTYNLNYELYSDERHPRQGFHIRLTIYAPQANGKIAKKTKVFWLNDCVDP